MKSLDSTFAQAVSLLIKEAGQKDEAPVRKSPLSMVKWSPGQGRWSEVIKGMKEEANVPYDKAIAASNAIKSSGTLMARLQVKKASTSSNPPEAAAQIMKQSLGNSAMSQLYGEPKGNPNSVFIPFKISTSKEDAASGEGISVRNATVFVHLTLIGAYNSGFLKIDKPVTLTPTDGGVRITA